VSDPCFTLRDVTRSFRLRRRSLLGPRPDLQAVRGVTMDVQDGEVLGIVGESGCGKTTLAHLLAGLDSPTSGTVAYRGTDVTTTDRVARRRIHRDVQLVFQDPMSSLDPRLKVGTAITEPLRSLAVDESHDQRLAELLEAVGLPDGSADRYPHEFSGGQRQRVAVARALAPRPSVLIADEPVSALDVSVRATILALLRDLQQRLGLTLVLITHDLSVVRYLCDRVAVMYLGRVVELGRTRDLFDNPAHPYTRALLEAVPRLDARLPTPLGGAVPSPVEVPPYCAFVPRCRLAEASCRQIDPRLRGRDGADVATAAHDQHLAACQFAFTKIGAAP